jgi:hypothetical protein
MMEPRCRNCAYWAPRGTDAGECRRHAPLPVLALHAPFATLEAFEGVGWPRTHSADWCGEFRPKEAAS